MAAHPTKEGCIALLVDGIGTLKLRRFHDFCVPACCIMTRRSKRNMTGPQSSGRYSMKDSRSWAAPRRSQWLQSTGKEAPTVTVMM